VIYKNSIIQHVILN